jgi:hypothetical protein
MKCDKCGGYSTHAPVEDAADNHVAWARYVIEHDRPTRIVLCDSDDEGAFRVYRWPEARIAELERLNLEAQHRIADLCVVVGNIEQCRCVEGDSVTILCDNPEADSTETQGVVEACGDYTGYKPERFYGKTWDEALAKAARVSQRHYSDDSVYEEDW